MKRLLLIFLLFPFLAYGVTTYYVATTGNDGNSGTIGSPFKTITHGISAMSSGDTLYVRGGTYNEQVSISTANITVSGYPGETAIVDGTGITLGSHFNLLLTASANNVTLTNLTVQNSYGGGIIMTGNGGKIANCISRLNTDTGIFYNGVGLVTDCQVYYNCLENAGFSNTLGSWGGGVATTGAGGTTISNCLIWNNWCEGLSTSQGGGNNVFVCNTVYDNSSADFYIQGTTNNLVASNLFYYTASSAFNPLKDYGNQNVPGNLVCLEIGNESAVNLAHHNTIVNNLCMGGARCLYPWYQFASPINNSTIAFNTFANAFNSSVFNDWNVEIVTGGSSTAAVFENNLMLQENPTAIGFLDSATGVTLSHNLWSVSPPSNMRGIADVVANPLLAESGSIGAGQLTPSWFNLGASSPAIAAGATLAGVGADFSGRTRPSPPAIGALEPLSGANSVTVVSPLRLVPTFECMSVYMSYSGDNNTNSVATLRYRVAGAGTYKNGLTLWTDNVTKSWKGSIVYLSTNTAYEVVVDITDPDGVSGTTSFTNTASTWDEVPIVASDAGWTSITNSAQTITVGGPSSTGFRLYGKSGTNRMTISGVNLSILVDVNANNTLIQNIDFIGGTQNCIKEENGITNCWIRNCTFSLWGWPVVGTGPNSVPDQYQNSAIAVGFGDPGGNYRCHVESCTINPPLGGANTWAQGHPTGSQGITYSQSLGQNVIRYNHVYGSTGHYYNDGIGGYQNESVNGAWGSDSDVYGNIVSEVNDDAIESDGGNRNVRIFGNCLTNCHVAISTAACNVGPCYNFRNLTLFCNYPSTVWLKRGISSSAPNPGREYILNNTAEGPSPFYNSIDVSGGDGTYNQVGRNNILVNVPGNSSIKDTGDWTSSFDYDNPLSSNFSTLPPAPGNEPHAVFGQNTYYTNAWYPTTTSVAYQHGTPISNILSDVTGAVIANPNIGAFDSRFVPLKLGPQLTSTGGSPPPPDPTITTQPQNQSIVVGSQANFSVVAGGTLPFTYQWSLNGVNIAGATLSSYTINPVTLTMNGNSYTVGVTNGIGGILSSPATLTVTPASPIDWYAAVTGLDSNDGLTTNTPKTLRGAVAICGVSNRVNVMNGTYNGGSTIAPTFSWMTIRAMNKWQAKIVNIPGTAVDTTYTDFTLNGLTLSGLMFSNCANEAIILRAGSNHIVQDCYVVDTGKTGGGTSQSQTGIETLYATLNCILQRNMSERNGRTIGNFDHGFYIGGTNHIIRDNVSRYNGAFGITFFAHTPGDVVNPKCYNNFVYYNGQNNTDGISAGVDFEPNNNNAGNVCQVFNNTIIETNGLAIGGGGVVCTLQYTNNMLYSSYHGTVRFLTGTMVGDYNMATNTLQFSGPHDVISSNYKLANLNTGLPWLLSGSPAINAGLNIPAPVDFFGNAQGVVTDIGAFQYSINYTNDSRVLDPSPTNGPDYWVVLPNVLTPPTNILNLVVVSNFNATTVRLGH